MRKILALLSITLLLNSLDAKGTQFRFGLHQSGNPPQFSHGKLPGHLKNFCAFIVQRNVTCIMQDGLATLIRPEYTTKCIWGQKCSVLTYKSLFKPQYKIGFKTITELEWRCCPGFSGKNCVNGPISNSGGKGSAHHPGLKGFPSGHPRIPSDPRLVPISGLEPGNPLAYPGGSKTVVTGERLDRIEDNLRRLSKEFDTLHKLVVGMEEHLRVSLREDTRIMLASLLTGSPRVLDASVGFGLLPQGTPNGLDGDENLPGFGELVGRVMEVKDDLRIKSNILEEIQGMVVGHDGQLKRLMDTASTRQIPADQQILEKLLDAKLSGIQADVLEGFEKRLSVLENHYDERIGQVQQQCHKEHLTGQEQFEQSLDGRETGLKKELGDLQAQILGLTVTENCCGKINGLTQRMLLLEDSVTGLTESQRQLQEELTNQTLRIETHLEKRILGVEGRLNGSEHDRLEPGWDSLDGFKTLLDDKINSLEHRLFVAVEELSNATAPALLEGQVVPALETEIDKIRRRVEADLDGMQRQMSVLELLCTSSCTPASAPETASILTKSDYNELEKKMISRLDKHSSILDNLNKTLQGLLSKLNQQDVEGSVQGEITLLKININSVNRTLKGLRDSVTLFTQEVSQANSSWQERENQLVTKVQGISDLVERQASLLGTGEQRLYQLKAELQSLRRKLSGELQGCRSTALGVQREVTGVESRISQVEGQCGSLGELAEDLERIRSELEKHSDQFLAQVNGTLVSHSEQLVKLKHGLKDCMSKTDNQGPRGDD